MHLTSYVFLIFYSLLQLLDLIVDDDAARSDWTRTHRRILLLDHPSDTDIAQELSENALSLSNVWAGTGIVLFGAVVCLHLDIGAALPIVWCAFAEPTALMLHLFHIGI